MFDLGDGRRDMEGDKDIDPHKILVVLDYDEVCYRLKESQFAYFKTAFALTALNLVPDFKPVIPAEDRVHYEQDKAQIRAKNLSALEEDHHFRLKDAFYTAVAGWEDHRDCTHYFTEHMDDAEKAKFREDFDRMAHSILPTHLWEPIEGLRDYIQELRGLGAEVIIWTHGRREMVMRTQQQNDLDWLFTLNEIYDKQSVLEDGHSIGRKDKGMANYARLCEQHGVLPENVVLVDDTKANHKSAAKAGIGLRVWVDWHKTEEAIIDYPKVKVDDTASGMKHAIKFVNDKMMEFGVLPDAANETDRPYQPRRAAGRQP